MVSQKAEAPIFGQTMKFIRANGIKVKNMGVVFGRVKKGIVTLANGNMGKLTDMEFTFGSTATATKVNLKIA